MTRRVRPPNPVRARCPIHNWVDADSNPDHQPRVTIYPTDTGTTTRLIFWCETCADWRHHHNPDGGELSYEACRRYHTKGVFADDLSLVPVTVERDSMPRITWEQMCRLRDIFTTPELRAVAVVEFIEQALADT